MAEIIIPRRGIFSFSAGERKQRLLERIGKDLSLLFEMTGIVILLSVGEPKVMTSVRHEIANSTPRGDPEFA
jgi:hypothetical protein